MEQSTKNSVFPFVGGLKFVDDIQVVCCLPDFSVSSSNYRTLDFPSSVGFMCGHIEPWWWNLSWLLKLRGSQAVHANSLWILKA
ncbi:unnamed protein product [Calypogeia fissa]